MSGEGGVEVRVGEQGEGRVNGAVGRRGGRGRANDMSGRDERL